MVEVIGVAAVVLVIGIFAAWMLKPPQQDEPEVAAPSVDPVETLADPYEPSAVPSTRNPVLRHWRGEYSLPVSYWIVGFTVNLLIFGTMALAPRFLPDIAYRPIVVFWLFAGIWGLAVITTIWQNTGLWRSAGRYIWRRSLQRRGGGWGRVVQVLVVVGYIALGIQVMNVAMPQIHESMRMAFRDDPDIPAFSLRVMRDGTEAEITGGIKYGLARAFDELLTNNPGVRVVHLNSPGGRIGEAKKLARTVRERGLVTYVSHSCRSACTLVFVSARERWLRARGAELGFHAGSFAGVRERDAALDQAYIDAGLDADFVRSALAVPPDSMMTPPLEALQGTGVVTHVSDGRQFAVSGMSGDISRDTFEGIITSIYPVLPTVKRKFTDRYEPLLDALHAGYVSGMTEAAMAGILSDALNRLYAASIKLGDDRVLVETGFVMIDIINYLGSRDPAACYAWIRGQAGERLDAHPLPASLAEREANMRDRTITSAEPRTPRPAEDISRLWREIGTAMAGSLPQDSLRVLGATEHGSGDYALYCISYTLMLGRILELQDADAASLMRDMLSK